jgi:hypothetical protein
MTAMTFPHANRLDSFAASSLRRSAQLWFLIALAGQGMFVIYVAAFYGGAAVQGDFERWNRVLGRAWVAGDTIGNLALAAHLLIAVVIMLGGPLQFLPKIRRVAPRFHRWNGRIYLPAVMLTSLAGLVMILRKEHDTQLLQHIGVSVDALLIIAFALLAWRTAVQRRISEHSRWAMRLFLVVNAGWFFRVGLILWVFLNGGPAGFDPKTFTGPFLEIWSFGDYLLPLALLELYWLARDRFDSAGKLATAGVLFVATVGMGIGIILATMGLWLPRLAG